MFGKATKNHGKFSLKQFISRSVWWKSIQQGTAIHVYLHFTIFKRTVFLDQPRKQGWTNLDTFSTIQTSNTYNPKIPTASGRTFFQPCSKESILCLLDLGLLGRSQSDQRWAERITSTLWKPVQTRTWEFEYRLRQTYFSIRRIRDGQGIPELTNNSLFKKYLEDYGRIDDLAKAFKNVLQ